MAPKELTPMMKQFFALKAKHPDAIMLFRCGDFYETYAQDAIEAAGILGITLTRRSNKGEGAGTEMAGFPYHALETYLPKLVRAGRRVAICDQLEDPKMTKKLVKRGITELVTPGIALSDNVLKSDENNFLAAVTIDKIQGGLSLLDISTGEFLVAQGDYKYIDKLIANFSPKEILIERSQQSIFSAHFGATLPTYILEDWVFAEEAAREKLYKHFGVQNLKGFGIDHLHLAIGAAGAIMQYLQLTQHTQTSHITSLVQVAETQFVRLDKFTIRNLELIRCMNEQGSSLLDVLNRTETPMGARLMQRWLIFPLRDINAIQERLDMVTYFYNELEFSSACQEALEQIGDLERLSSKIATARITPREMQQLRYALDAIVPIKRACECATLQSLQEVAKQLDTCDTLRQRIAQEIMHNPPLLVSKGGIIAQGVNAELDNLRCIAHSGKDYLLQLQNKESEVTGIQSLKIGFNNVFGYYIEVRNTYKEKVPPTWIRKQTLINAERYITEELKDYEEKILGAEEKILRIEQQLYEALVTAAQSLIHIIQHNATTLATLDCLFAFAKVAKERDYHRPTVNETHAINIQQGRHPVIETQLGAGESYVPNDIILNDNDQQIIMLTGPNMAGKSALLRQTALITLMAQIGCYVPAQEAEIGFVDKIFTRVGASDNISMGESTFMVEMNEAANIMNNLTERSLVLFDELGRGTSTYDGISLAWAIVEHIHEHRKGKARTLFATHYHELNEMEKLYPRIKNYNVSVKEIDGHVVFMRKLVRGGSEHSFGIHVAKLAGMPPSIVRRAEIILQELESNSATANHLAKPATKHLGNIPPEGMQLSFFQLDDPLLCQIRDEILTLDIDTLTPIEALNKLHGIKRLLKGK